MARIGIVQTRGIGDIVIALPIAAAFAQRGDTVYWPVNAPFITFLAPAAPWVNFIPVPPEAEKTQRRDYYFGIPRAELEARDCDEVFVLYSSWEEPGYIQNERLAQFLKFDEYKYAVAGIPFREKWNLKLERDRAREARFFDSLGIEREFICVHRTATGFVAQVTITDEWRRDYQLVEIDERGTPFDWLTTMERAAKLVMVDSCFANLAEQLNLPNEKYLLLRAPGPFTPVLKNGWQFL